MPAVLVYPNVSSIGIMELIRTELANCKVKLFQNDYVPAPGTVIGALTEADYGGYAAKTVAALLPAYIDPAGGASAQIPTQQFQCDGTAPSNIVYGFWVETAGGDLRLAGRFDQPVTMELATDAIPLDVKFNFGG